MYIRLLFVLFFITIVLSYDCFAENFTLSGFVFDIESGERLIGASIFNDNSSGTVSNSYGFYSLTIPSGSYSISCSYVGYISEKIDIKLNKDTTLNFYLETKTLDEVVIHDKNSRMKFQSKINFEISKIQKLPAILGEVDVFKSLQFLPGVNAGREGTSGLIVRGGSIDQNLILLDGVPIYNGSHLFGFFSIFNPASVKRVEITKSGFPARFGGRLSSVIEVRLNDGNKERLKGEGSIGLISSQLNLEGPIIKDRTSFVLSGRRTYIDLLTAPFLNSKNRKQGYYFYDLSGKFHHRLSKTDNIYMSTYLGRDMMYDLSKNEFADSLSNNETIQDFRLSWGNIISALQWTRIWNDKLFSDFKLTFSQYQFNVEQRFANNVLNNELDENAINYSQYFSRIRDFSAISDFEYYISRIHTFRMGFLAINHKFNPGVLNFETNRNEAVNTGSNEIEANELAIYAEDEIALNSRLNINLGLRFSSFLLSEKNYKYLQPRLYIGYTLSDQLSLNFSYTEMVQYIHLLTNGGIGLPTDLWVPATDFISPQRSNQISLGIENVFDSNNILTLGSYYKNMTNVIEYQEGATLINVDDDWQEKVATGNGESYGFELMFEKGIGRTTGWISYTLSWNWRYFDDLNFGERFPYKYDRRHDISISLLHDLNKNINCSLAWVFGSGNALSFPIRTYPNSSFLGNEILYYNGRNSFRMPPYHRLDASINFTKEKKWGERTWHIGVYNLYNRQNPFFIDLEGYQNRRIVSYALFPIIPSVKYSFKF